jgi:hypothetical protein
VVLRDGALLAWLAKSEEQVLTFVADGAPDAEAARADLAAALASLVGEGGARRTLHLATIDGEPAFRSALAPALLAAGFSRRAEALFKAWRAREESGPVTIQSHAD